jgi:hypothetical protein
MFKCFFAFIFKVPMDGKPSSQLVTGCKLVIIGLLGDSLLKILERRPGRYL